MLKVKVELRPSKIHGVGVFCLEDIYQGQTVAEECNRDILYPSVLDADIADYVKKHGYLTEKGWILPFGDERYMNHSDRPNVRSMMHHTKDVANFAIKAGTELTVNYYHFDAAAEGKLK